MRSTEDKGYYEISSSSGISFEFHKGDGATNRGSHHRTGGFGKPTPSKWDDAQKWLVGLSRGRNKGQPETTPRNSNADDRRLIAPVPQKEQDCSSSEGEGSAAEETNGSAMAATAVAAVPSEYQDETKQVDCDESIWRINYKPANQNSTSVVRSVCVRDMGTEMTPAASQEPSRTATPIRAISPSARNPTPITSGSSTPVRCRYGQACAENHQAGTTTSTDAKGEHETNGAARGNGSNGLHEQESRIHGNNNSDQVSKQNTLETRAMAWDEAERAKYMARIFIFIAILMFGACIESIIGIWVKAERLKARAKEKCANKLAATRRIAEEKRANAESKLNEKAMRTSERADYIRRTGHLPSSFSFKLPPRCW
ncbi:ATP phosphoribosyltransferase [Gossypium australe]|uniref:ATP phosphoribosyltransferase n=1 Tax=Gossypium australe TaxID=47621 RepID=A0A5B6U626_9ROSI|nr:ATP phosphoribosyltransferase [Gossypium australe]